VKPPPPRDPLPGEASGTGNRIADTLPGRPEVLLELAPRGYKALTPGSPPLPGRRAADAMLRRPGEPPPATPTAPQWPAPHGFTHDSPVVTGNAGMFYRDGQGRSDPYTWAEFLRHLERRVKADDQPKLVRAKYGVGFYLEGGDMPRWDFDPDAPGAETSALRLDDGTRLSVPTAQLTAPLEMREMRDYQRRLGALIGLGETEPTAVLSDAAARTLWRLGLLAAPGDGALAMTPAGLAERFGTDMGPGWGVVLRTDTPAVREALHAFRELVGKTPPDDPAHLDLLLPAERAALEIYGARVARLVAAARSQATDLERAGTNRKAQTDGNKATDS
jgi:hypothetical protein